MPLHRPASTESGDPPGFAAHASDRPYADPTAAPVHLRRAQPDEALQPRTAMWLADMPEALRPVELANRYPRVANRLCATWSDPAARDDYLEDLITGRDRPGRRGFPVSVLQDLRRLRAVHRIARDLNRRIWEPAVAEC